MSRARLLPALVAVPAVLLLSACGAAGTTTAAPTDAPGGAGGQLRNSEQFQQIQECLTAAGIALPTPSGTFSRPSGTPGEGFAPPSGAPDRTPPSGAPDGTPPSGGPRGGGPGFGQLLDDPQVQAALDACGIAMPTGRPSGAQSPPSTP